jgi:putative transposase
MPTMGERRTLEVGQGILTGADHPQAPRGGGQTRLRLLTVAEVARELGISEATFHRWKNHYGGMSTSEAKRLKELEKENARLKKLLAEKELDIDILKEVNRGNF